jgi:hypothetical protein
VDQRCGPFGFFHGPALPFLGSSGHDGSQGETATATPTFPCRCKLTRGG